MDRRWLEYTSAMLLGVATAGLLALAAGGGTKLRLVLLGGLVGVSALALLAFIRGAVHLWLTFGFAATLSLSIKFHFVYRMEHLGGAVGVRMAITDILLALLAMFAYGRARRRGAAVLRVDPLLAAAAGAYLCWALVSTLASEDQALGWFQLSAVVQAVAVYLFLASCTWTDGARRMVIAGLLCGLILQSGVAIVQSVRPGLISLEAIGAWEDTESGDGAIPEVDLGTTTVAGDVVRRPTGLLIHPNVLAAYFVLTIPLAVAVALTGATRLQRILAVGASSLSAGALYLSLSRSGWAGVACALCVGAFFAWRWRAVRLSRFQKLAAAAACAVVLLGVAAKADRIYLRIVETADEAFEFRRNLAQMAWDMTTAHPAAGVGLNTFIYHAEQYDRTYMSRLKAFPVHNVYLLELAETGFPGGLAFLGIVAAMLWRTFRSVRETASAETKLVVLALAAGLAGFWLTQLSDYVYRIPVLTTLVWAHVGLALGFARSEART